MAKEILEELDPHLAGLLVEKVLGDFRAGGWDKYDDVLAFELCRSAILGPIREERVRGEDIPVLLDSARRLRLSAMRLFAIHAARVKSPDGEWDTFRSLAKQYFDEPVSDPRIKVGLVFQILHRVDDPDAARYVDWCWRNPGPFVGWSLHYFGNSRELLLRECTREPRIGDPAYRAKFPLYLYLVGYLGAPDQAPWIRAQCRHSDRGVAEAAQWALDTIDLRENR